MNFLSLHLPRMQHFIFINLAYKVYGIVDEQHQHKKNEGGKFVMEIYFDMNNKHEKIHLLIHYPNTCLPSNKFYFYSHYVESEF